MQTESRSRSIRASLQVGIVALYFVVVLMIDKFFFEAARWEWPSWTVAAMHTFLWFLTSVGGILSCHIRAKSYGVVLVANMIFILLYQCYYLVLIYFNIESSSGVYWLGLVFLLNVLVGLYLPRIAWLKEKEIENKKEAEVKLSGK